MSEVDPVVPVVDPVTDPVTDPAPANPAPNDPAPNDAPANHFAAMPDSWRQDLVRNGELSNGLPENPTEEQLADYREANGVPESPDKYELSLDEGLVLGDEDNRILEGVYKVAHESNIPAATLSSMTNAMLAGREAEAEAIQTQDGVDSQTTSRQLKDAWKGDYQTNLNMVQGLTAQLPESIRTEFEGARMADGKAMFNSPEVMVFFADMARKLNPAGTVVPNSANPTQAISDEIAKLEGRMGDDGWHKDTAAQARIQQLYKARDDMKQ